LTIIATKLAIRRINFRPKEKNTPRGEKRKRYGIEREERYPQLKKEGKKKREETKNKKKPLDGFLNDLTGVAQRNPKPAKAP